MDTFKTIQAPAQFSHLDRGSRFLSLAFPVTTEPEISVILQKLKKEHPKASHFCTAMRLNPDASLVRSSDDGEPSGSAGKPILGQILRLDLTNLWVVIIRYFGGTKLGVPGLIEAYKTGAAGVLESATIITKQVLQPLNVRLRYEDQPSFLNYCMTHEVPVLDQQFDDKATLTLGILPSKGQGGWKEILRHYSKMDFQDENEYLQYLGFEVTWNDDLVIR